MTRYSVIITEMAIMHEIDNSIIEPNVVLDVHQKQKMENGYVPIIKKIY